MNLNLKTWLSEQSGCQLLPLKEIDLTGLEANSEREWLITNGLGSYAAGAISGANTRRYHALLVASHNHPVERAVHLSHLDEVLTPQGGIPTSLSTSLWKNGVVSPKGYLLLESFAHLPTPTWCYRLPSGRLVKQLVMKDGEQHIFVGYTWLPDDAKSEANLTVAFLLNHRDFHSQTRGANNWHFSQEKLNVTVEPGLAVKVSAFPGAPSLYLQSNAGSYEANGTWYWGYYWPREYERGLEASEDCYRSGFLKVTLAAGQSITLAAGLSMIEALPEISQLVKESAAHKEGLIKKGGAENATTPVKALILAADQFLVHRKSTGGFTTIAGYPWFSDWGRDSMIGLSGLCLSTGRFSEARSILSTFARYCSQGMLPNYFPDNGTEPTYNTADAALWWAYALYRYYQATDDKTFVLEQLPLLREVINWHQRGTRHGLKLENDNLITGGNPHVQLTWMDAKCGDYVATPRAGKAVEINALWHNFVATMTYLHRQVYPNMTIYGGYDVGARQGFEKFWLADRHYLADLIRQDGTIDDTIRPNQIFAASLPYPVLSQERAREMLAVVEDHLLTDMGLRTLSPKHADYKGQFGLGKASASQYDRDRTYHQGTVWPWLLGPWVNARIYAFGESEENFAFIRKQLQPLIEHIEKDGCIGSISEIFDGDAPHKARGCPAQAWSVAELLRVLREFPKLELTENGAPSGNSEHSGNSH